jgi:hypothetical protein
MDLRTIGLDVMDWIHLAGAESGGKVPVNTVMNLRVPQKTGHLLTSSASFPRTLYSKELVTNY